VTSQEIQHAQYMDAELRKCKEKRRFLDAGSATAHFVRFAEKFKGSQVPYKCPHCSFFHLTTVK
jgi:hypothetical protein